MTQLAMKNDYQARMAQLAKAGLLTEKKARDLDYQTPRRVLDRVDLYYGGQIPLDPATVPGNPTRARRFYAPTDAEVTLASAWYRAHKTANLKRYLEAPAGPFVVKAESEDEEDRTYVWEPLAPERDGLRATWDAPVFVNPPYGVPMKAWLEKIGQEAARGLEIVALIPVNRTETDYWQEVAVRSSMVCFVRKRVAFVRPKTGEPARGNPYASSLWGFNTSQERFERAFGPLGRCFTLYCNPAIPGPIAPARAAPKKKAIVQAPAPKLAPIPAPLPALALSALSDSF